MNANLAVFKPEAHCGVWGRIQNRQRKPKDEKRNDVLWFLSNWHQVLFVYLFERTVEGNTLLNTV